MIMILNNTIMLLASASGEHKKQTSKKKAIWGDVSGAALLFWKGAVHNSLCVMTL